MSPSHWGSRSKRAVTTIGNEPQKGRLTRSFFGNFSLGLFLFPLAVPFSQQQWCRSTPIARGALLIARGCSFLACIFIGNFEAKSTHLYKQMIMFSSKQYGFYYPTSCDFSAAFSPQRFKPKIAVFDRMIHVSSRFKKIYRVGGLRLHQVTAKGLRPL